jgi:hypothetical protein
LQAVLQVVAQGDFDDGGFDEHLRALDVQALEGGRDALVFGRAGVDEQGVVDAVGHDAHVAGQGGGDDVGAARAALLLADAARAGETAAAETTAAEAAAGAKAAAAKTAGAEAPAGAEAAGAAGAEAAGAAGAELVAVGAELAGEAVVDVAVAAGAGEAGGDAGEAAEAGAGLGGGAVDAVEQLGQVVGGAVLHLVDEQLGFGAVDVGLVEALDPVAHFVEVGGARGDDQHGVDALDGDDAQGTEQGAGFAHALQGGGGAGGALRGRGGRGRAGARGGAGGGARGGSGGGAAGEHAQGVVDLGGAGVFEREHADGHAAQEVDVEGLDEVEPAFGLGAGAAHDEHVAQVVDADDGVGGDHGLQDFGHLAGAQVFERDDDGAVAGRQGFAGLGQHGGGNDALEGFGGADVVGAAGSRAMTMPLTWSADSSSSRARSALTLPRVVRVMVPLSGG